MRVAVLAVMMAATVPAVGGDKVAPPTKDGVPRPVEERVEVPPPPFSDGIFPCSNCHASQPVNRTRRQLTEMHTDIDLRHDETHRWCLDCHDATNRDFLHLASGERVAFDESYRLCGQCHGEKLRDWRAGVHGRRTGNWNGAKGYLLCAHCHNPHQPRFHALAPKPAPLAAGATFPVSPKEHAMDKDDNSSNLTRRGFAAAAAGAATWIMTSCGPKRLYEVPKERLRTSIAEMERRYADRLGTTIHVADTPPMPGVEFAYALDISRCIGCRRCVYACVQENNQSRDPQIQWIRVLSMEKEKGVDLSHADPYYNPPEVPEEGHFYVPVQCQHCENPPCTKVCPTGATWTERDGIVVVDYDWCIGCRYCMAACPYGARHFNWTEPSIPRDEINPNTHYLGNRPRPKGVVEKCTFCIQRTRQGRYPACEEVCPVGARKFGNLLDKDGEIRYIIEHKRVFVLKEELNTVPRFFYFYAT